MKKEALGDTVDRPPISRVGVFHFGKRDEGKPIVQLHCALDNEDAGSLKSSLLVLPEGFNVVGSYLKGYDHERTILSSLIELSRHFGVAFLVGLMEGGRPPDRLNASYLIDGNVMSLLACKRCQDRFGGYRPSRVFKARTHRGMWIVSLICIDSWDGDGNTESAKLCECLRSKMKNTRWDGLKTILSIPAHMTRTSPKDTTERWSGFFDSIAVSNSATDQSVIYLRDQRHNHPDRLGTSNWISFVSTATC